MILIRYLKIMQKIQLVFLYIFFDYHIGLILYKNINKLKTKKISKK